MSDHRMPDAFDVRPPARTNQHAMGVNLVAAIREGIANGACYGLSKVVVRVVSLLDIYWLYVGRLVEKPFESELQIIDDGMRPSTSGKDNVGGFFGSGGVACAGPMADQSDVMIASNTTTSGFVVVRAEPNYDSRKLAMDRLNNYPIAQKAIENLMANDKCNVAYFYKTTEPINAQGSFILPEVIHDLIIAARTNRANDVDVVCYESTLFHDEQGMWDDSKGYLTQVQRTVPSFDAFMKAFRKREIVCKEATIALGISNTDTIHLTGTCHIHLCENGLPKLTKRFVTNDGTRIDGTGSKESNIPRSEVFISMPGLSDRNARFKDAVAIVESNRSLANGLGFSFPGKRFQREDRAGYGVVFVELCLNSGWISHTDEVTGKTEIVVETLGGIYHRYAYERVQSNFLIREHEALFEKVLTAFGESIRTNALMENEDKESLSAFCPKRIPSDGWPRLRLIGLRKDKFSFSIACDEEGVGTHRKTSALNSKHFIDAGQVLYMVVGINRPGGKSSTFKAGQLFDTTKQGYRIEDRPHTSVRRGVREFFTEEFKNRPELSAISHDDINILEVRANVMHYIEDGRPIDIDSGEEYVQKQEAGFRPKPNRRCHLQLRDELADGKCLATLLLKGVPEASGRDTDERKTPVGTGGSNRERVLTRAFEDEQMYATVEDDGVVLNENNLVMQEGLKDLPDDEPTTLRLLEDFYRKVEYACRLAQEISNEEDIDGAIAEKKKYAMRKLPGLSNISTKDRIALIAYQLISSSLKEGRPLSVTLDKIGAERRRILTMTGKEPQAPVAKGVILPDSKANRTSLKMKK